MEQSGLAAITKFIMRDRQNLGCIRVRDGALTLEQMYFADEIRPLDEIRPRRAKVERQELEMALQLIDRFSGEFDASKYRDTYREALRHVIDAKRKGKEVHAVAEVEDDDAPPDLMEALRQSIQQASGSKRRGSARRPTASRSRNGNGGNGGLEGKSKEQLMQLAKRADIAGRSQMDKQQLVKALRAR